MSQSQNQGRGRLLACVALCCCLGLTGCGQATGTVSGKVTYKKRPLTTGKVILYAGANQAPYSAQINPDGTFVVDRVPVGSAVVTVQSMVPPSLRNPGSPAPPRSAGAFSSPQPPMPGAAGSGLRLNVPLLYADPGKTPLRCEVQRGANPPLTLDLE